MNEITESVASRYMNQALRTRFRADYNLSLSRYDEETGSEPACTHHLTGSTKHSLGELLALIGIVALFCVLLHGFCRVVRRICDY